MIVPTPLFRALTLAAIGLALGAAVDPAHAGSFEVSRPATKDSFVRPGQRSRNEGSNAILPLR